jgi:hypothetical protein
LEPKFRKVGADKAPGSALFPVYPPPGILIGKGPTDENGPMGIQVVTDTSGNGAERQKTLIAGGIERSLSYAQIDSRAFAILLAKIAHGYAVFNVGLTGFRPLLPPIIRGEDRLRRQQAGLQPIRSVRWGQRQLYWRPPPCPSQRGSRAKRLPPAHRINVRPNNSRSWRAAKTTPPGSDP